MERYDFRTKRLYVSENLHPEGTLTCDRAQANYLLNVLRLKNGGQVLLFNGRDGEWLAEVVPTARKSCDLMLKRQLRAQPDPYDLLFCFAPIKQARMEYIVEKAVEMGAGQLQPVLTDHTQLHKINADRLRAHTVEAAEQCGILNVPQLQDPLKLQDLISGWRDQHGDRHLIFCDELSDASENTDRLNLLADKLLAVIVGPEGGFSEAERSLLRKQAFVTGLSLGPRILRADTAAVAALAIVQSFIGDCR